MKLEPIDMFLSVVDSTCISARAGDRIIEKNGDSVVLSSAMATMLAKEAFAYKEFTHWAIALAKAIDQQTAGMYVAPRTLERLKDEYVSAKRRALEIIEVGGMNGYQVVREYLKPQEGER